jgi:hypothetical protein
VRRASAPRPAIKAPMIPATGAGADERIPSTVIQEAARSTSWKNRSMARPSDGKAAWRSARKFSLPARTPNSNPGKTSRS